MKPTTVFGNAKIWNETDECMRVQASYGYKMIVGEKMHEFSMDSIESMFEIPIDSEFTLDIPGEEVLHKFRGLQYLGGVDREDIEIKIKKLLDRCYGAVVVEILQSEFNVIRSGKIIIKGCRNVGDIIGKNNMDRIGSNASGNILYWRLERSVVGKESVLAARAHRKEFMDAYERIMK